ncbi:MAG: sulfatase-like hydrolase/transferase [Chloroflexota bacterium]
MKEKPNILLIVADQHRYDCMGAYGNTDIQTPTIDDLAQDGVLFENSFCPHPVCTPSRYSLLSGLYIHQHRCLTNRSTLASDIPTLPHLLKQHGYRTTAVGKMHFTPTYLDVGFDDMMLAEQNGDGRYADDYHRWLRAEGRYDYLDMIDQIAEFRRDAPASYWASFGAFPSDLDEQHHSTTWIGDRALERIERWDEDTQNFLMVSFIKPHHPFDPPEPWASMYNADTLSLLPGWTEDLIHDDDGKSFFDYDGLSEVSLRRVMALYYATISQIDHHVGRMIEQLKEKGLYDNTVIVYTSDHGDYMGYHHRILKGYRLLEPLVRVPLIIKYPDSAHSQQQDDRLVNNIDVAPTLLTLAGVTPPDSMAGVNLMDAEAGSDYVFAETRDEYMVRSKRHKLLLHREYDKSMFFDLNRDPLEQENLFGSEAYQSEIAALRNWLSQFPLFDDRITNHLDDNAPQCRGDNVPDKDTGLYDYFKSIMTNEVTVLPDLI